MIVHRLAVEKAGAIVTQPVSISDPELIVQVLNHDSGADDVVLQGRLDDTSPWTDIVTIAGTGVARVFAYPQVRASFSSGANRVSVWLAGRPASGGANILIGDVVGLRTELDDKADLVHAHASADITTGTVNPARLGSGTPDNTKFLRGDSSWQVVSVPGAANPTASIGLVAVNGSAGTFLRSDGAPALDVSISPTWTGQHTFAAGTITTSKPLTITQTWNNAAVTFNGLLMNVTNTASNAASALIDLQVGGVSQFKATRAGWVTADRFTADAFLLGPVVRNSTNNSTLTVDGGPIWSSSNTGPSVKLASVSVTTSSGMWSAVSIVPTYNQTSTAGATDLLINRTQIAVGSGAQLLLDAQVGGTSKFKIDTAGIFTATYGILAEQGSAPSNPAAGFVALYVDNAGNLKYKLSDGTVKTVIAI